ncbi:MAG: hypothetical protein ACXVZZ_04710 [Terriglobales bacterium]
MHLLLALVLIIIGLFFIWRVFKLASKYKPVEEPPEEVGDINVREPAPRRPKGRAGAVAIELPDDDYDTDAYSRR